MTKANIDKTIGLQMLELADFLPAQRKKDSCCVSFWVDKAIYEELKEYCEELGITYSQLWRGIFLLNLPDAQDVQEKLRSKK